MTTNISADDLLVRMQYTPNPMALKFVANMPFKNEGKAAFNAAVEAEGVPLVRDLFYIMGVKQVHVFQNTITVTHDGSLDEDQLCLEVTAVIRSRYATHNPDFGEAVVPEASRKEHPLHEDPEMNLIEEILDRTIRPGLQADGGDIELIKREGDDVYILYQGACGGCPSSMMGTLDAIQGILRHEMQSDTLSIIPV
jgi:Fe-S cluster biogenesis protein NfuA